jgi:hypothetical protein
MTLNLHRYHRYILIDLTVFIVCLLFSGWLMVHTFSYRDGTLIMASKVWSDFAAHLPLIRSFSVGDNFPPEYPTFPGEPIRYHYLFYLVVGLIEKTGLNLALSLNLFSILGFGLLLWMIYKTTILFFSSRKAGLIAIILFLFNGSFSFIEYFHKFGFSLQSFLDIPKLEHFVTFGPWDGKVVSAFWNLNIYTNQRHLGLSFGLALVVLYPFIKVLCRRLPTPKWWYPGLAVIMLLMPILHQAAFLMVWLVAVGITFLDLRQIKRYFPLVFALAAGSIPGILAAPVVSSQNIVFQIGFLSNTARALPLLKYWLYNIGLYLPLIPILLVWLKRPGKIFLLSLLPLFILANLFRLSPDMINNHKLVNFFLIGLTILTAGFIQKLWRKSLLTAIIAICLMIGLTYSGIIDFFPIYNDYYSELPDIPRAVTATWIRDHTPPKSVFLTTTYLYNPASLAGRKTFEDYGYFNWSMGYNDSVRREELSYLFSHELPRASICRHLIDNRIDYVIISPGRGDLGILDPQQSTLVTTLKPTYQSSEGYSIYDVSQNCH